MTSHTCTMIWFIINRKHPRLFLVKNSSCIYFSKNNETFKKLTSQKSKPLSDTVYWVVNLVKNWIDEEIMVFQKKLVLKILECCKTFVWNQSNVCVCDTLVLNTRPEYLCFIQNNHRLPILISVYFSSYLVYGMKVYFTGVLISLCK